MYRKTKKRKIPFRRFWNMKNLTDEGAIGFTARIMRCGAKEARQTWKTVQNISKANPDDPHVRYCDETGKWRGKYIQTDRISCGIVELEGTLRTNFQYLEYRSKEKVIERIMETENCDEPSAKRMFGSGVRNRKPVFRHHKKTNTWGGALAPEPKVDAVPHHELTQNQIELRQRYGDIPELRNSSKPEKSEVVKWIAAFDKCSLEEANNTFERLRKCTTIDAIRPIRFDQETRMWMGYRTAEKGSKAKGDRRSETAQNAEIFRQMPRMHENSTELNVWLLNNVIMDLDIAKSQLSRAENRGDVVELSGNDRDGYELAGADWKPEQAADEDIPRNAEYDDEDYHEADDADEDDDGEGDEDDAESDSECQGYEDPEEKARRAKEAAERQADLKAKMDALRAQLDADDHVDRDPSRKAAEADPRPQPAPTVSGDPEPTEVAQKPAQEAPRGSWSTVRATPRPQYPQEYADSEDNLAQWRADVFRSRERDNDEDTPTDYPTEVEVEA